MKRSLSYMIALVVCIATGLACRPNNDARVQIEYDQVANFTEYKSGFGGSTGAGDGVFIMYRIEKITNTGSQAKTFTFNRNKLSTVTTDKTSNEQFPHENDLLDFVVVELTVQPGETKIKPGCFIKHALTPNPKLHVGALVPLLHQQDQSQPVTLTRSPNDKTTAQIITAVSETLKQTCGI